MTDHTEDGRVQTPEEDPRAVDPHEIREQYDIGEQPVECLANATGPDPHVDEPEVVTARIKGIRGHYHVRFPMSMGWVVGKGTYHLQAVAVRGSVHGRISFKGLYKTDDNDPYILRRYIDDGHGTRGAIPETPVHAISWIDENDIVWVADEQLRGDGDD